MLVLLAIAICVGDSIAKVFVDISQDLFLFNDLRLEFSDFKVFTSTFELVTVLARFSHFKSSF